MLEVLFEFVWYLAGCEPDENAVTIEDWAATIYNRLGIVADKELMAPGDRPIEIVDGGEVIQNLII